MTSRIYVRALGAYNNGILHGRWIDVSSDVDEMQDEIKEMLSESPIKGEEEWAVHDSESLPNFFGEFPQLKDLAAFEELVEENPQYDRDVMVAIVEDFGSVANTDMDCVIGMYAEFSDYSNELADSLLDSHKTPDAIRSYFDYGAYERDLKLETNSIDTPQGVVITSS
ncbi:antirestriction protein ArdA [Rhizobium arsenicireducens]